MDDCFLLDLKKIEVIKNNKSIKNISNKKLKIKN